MGELRDLDIDIDLEVDASELVAVNGQINALIANIERIDDMIKIDVRVNGLSAIEELAHLQAMIDALDRQTVRVNIDVDIAAATAKLALLQSRIDGMNGQHIPIIITSNGTGNNGPPQDLHTTLHLHTDEAMRKITAIRAQLERIDGMRVQVKVDIANHNTLEIERLKEQLRDLDDILKIHVDADISAAMRKLATVKTMLATMRTHTVRIDVDMGGAMAQLLALQALLRLLRRGGGGGGDDDPLPPLPNPFNVNIGHPLMMAAEIGLKMYILVQAIQALSSVAIVAVGAVGTLGVALGVLGSGALALVGSLGVAAMGFGGVAAMVVPNIMKLYDENAKLNKLQQETKTHIKSLASAWDGFTNRTQATALDLTSHGVNVLKTSLTMLEPIITSGANAMDILMHNLDRSLQGERMTAFFDSMKRQIPQMTEWIGNGLGNIGQTAANLMTAFEPLTMWMGEGFNGMMKRMADWSFDLQGSDKLKSFIEYIKTNLPLLGSGLGNAVTGVTKWFAGFGDTASKGIKWFSDTMKDFDTWSSNLSTNDGFQKMLSDIERMAPKVADAIGLVSESVMTLVDKLASGNGLDNFVSLLEGINNTLNGNNLVGDFLFGSYKEEMPLPKNTSAGALLAKGALKAGGSVLGWLFGNNKGSTLADREINVTANTSKLTQSIDGAVKGPFDVPAKVNELLPPMQIKPVEIPAEVKELKPPMQIDSVEVPAEMKSLAPPKTMTPVDIAAEVKEVKPPMQIAPVSLPAKVEKVETPPVLPTMELAAKVNKIEPPTTAMAPKLEAPMRVTSVEKPPTLPSLELAGRVHKIDPPPTGALPVAEMTGRVNQVEKPPSLPTMDLAARVNTIEPPPRGAMPAVDVPAKVTNVEAPRTLPAIDVPAKMTTIEPPPMRTVSLPVKASSVDTSGLPAVRMPLSLSGTNPLNNFKWPPLPTFTFPALPTFTFPPLPSFSWPPLPQWSWPPMPKFNWPAYPKFSWPPFPAFSWPPMPTVKVSVSGADGSHSSGLGRVPFDGYIGELHKNEAVLTASQADTLRSMGMLRGDGARPTLNTAAASTYVTAAPTRSGGANIQLGDVHITVHGASDAQQTAVDVREQVERELERKFAQLKEMLGL